MPAPKRIASEKPSRRAPKGIVGSTYETLTSPDNAAVVRSIAAFGVSLDKPEPLGSFLRCSPGLYGVVLMETD